MFAGCIWSGVEPHCRFTDDTVLAEAKRSAAVTHNHPEGIKGAQATALAVYLARTGRDKAALKQEIERRSGWPPTRPERR